MASRGGEWDQHMPIHHYHEDDSRSSYKRPLDVAVNEGQEDQGDYFGFHSQSPYTKRQRANHYAHAQPFLTQSNPGFVILRQNGVPQLRRMPAEHVIPMERTASGHSIRPDPTERCASTELLEDDVAALRVKEHMTNFKRRFPDSKHERILRSIINPRGRRLDGGCISAEQEAQHPLDNDALESLFSAANEVFFNGRLSQRVRWDWSHESAARYDAHVIGTTALRRAARRVDHGHCRHNEDGYEGDRSHKGRGFETLIVLSGPILRDARYSRRLLLSTFLHELIHSYMFICCGFQARHNGGHTLGFRTIAQLIDDWIGPESGLHLSKMEADLDAFLLREDRHGGFHDAHHKASVAHEYSPLGSTVVSVLPCSGYAGDCLEPPLHPQPQPEACQGTPSPTPLREYERPGFGPITPPVWR